MSLHKYLKDNRGLLIDHRMPPPAPPGPGVPLDDDSAPAFGAASHPGRKRRSGRSGTRMAIRYRHVIPAFSPSPWTEPLPYESPLDRARRLV